MPSPDMDDFVRKCNEASREAKQAGLSSDDLAVCLMKMASREFQDSTELQNEFDTFAQFAKTTEFEIREGDQNIRDLLERVDDLREE